MEWLVPLVAILGGMLTFLLLGVPVGFAFLFITLTGFTIVIGGMEGLTLLALLSFRSVSSLSLLAIPLFIFLGTYFFESGMAEHLFNFVDAFLGRVRSRLNYIAIVGGGLFGALSGSALAGTAVFGRILGPRMKSQHYSREFLVGPIVSGGTLAMLIPPSLIAVVLGSQANISISKLLIGGIIPGACLILGYIIWNLLRIAMKPELAPEIESRKLSVSQRLRAIGLVLPFTMVVFLVTGIIYLGVATPSEAAAVGCLGLIVVTTAYTRKLNLVVLWKATMEGVKVTGLCMLIIMSATAFSRLLAYTGATPGLVNFIGGLSESSFIILILTQVIVLFLGMWLDSISIIVLISPLLAPLIQSTGIDPVWFGLLTLTNLLLGGKSPPFGLCLFVLKGVIPDLSMSEIYRGVIPYLIIDGLVIALMLVFPEVFLYIPNLIIR